MLAGIQASKDFIGWRVVVLSPNYLSNAMLQRYPGALLEHFVAALYCYFYIRVIC